MDHLNHFEYPHLGGQSELIETVKRYHNNDYKHVVVANGAKQALAALFYAYKQEGYLTVWHETPFWPTYKALADLSGLQFVPWSNLTVATSPNNPCGRESTIECDIADCAYASPVYGHSITPKHEVSVWSAAKLFGVAGLRVGWLCTNNEKLARTAANYIEKTTSGVNVNAQLHVDGILKFVIANPSHVATAYNRARQILLENGKMFLHYLGNYIDDCQGLPVSGKGGFAWFKVNDLKRFNDALATSNVKMLPGAACGGDSDYFRCTLMYNSDHTGEALEALRKGLRHGS